MAGIKTADMAARGSSNGGQATSSYFGASRGPPRRRMRCVTETTCTPPVASFTMYRTSCVLAGVDRTQEISS